MKSPAPQLDATPALASQVIDLYSSSLTDVRFPDLDLEDLLALQNDLHDAQLEIERLEAELAQARSELEVRSQALLTKSERALAYARVYAQGDEELTTRLSEIGRSKRSGTGDAGASLGEAPAKRGRKPKAAKLSTLFNESNESPESSEETEEAVAQVAE